MISSSFTLKSTTAAVLAVGLVAGVQAATQVRVTVENLAPTDGVVLTPVWLAVHNGGFDLYDSGLPASAGLERLAEDGNTGPISAAFSGHGYTEQMTLASGGAPFFPGDSASHTFMLDASDPMHRYLSYASMVIPSNDAFVANGNPVAWDLTDGAGNFRSFSFVVLGSNVLDAGTEVNDEALTSTPLLGQTVPNTGTTENGVVGAHSGFNPGGPILTSSAGADFTQPSYQIARLTVTAVPEPEAYALMLAGLAVVVGVRRRVATIREDALQR